jgi:isoleucyl-tRNA synthetase
VKEVEVDPQLESPVLLDTAITPELKAEGSLRDLIRSIQDLRKRSNCTPNDRVALSVAGNEAGRAFIETNRDEIVRAALLSSITPESSVASEPFTIDGMEFAIELRV